MYARCHLSYEPLVWNVNDITLVGDSRTNNICEAFMKLVGHVHPTIWRAIDSLRKDQDLVEDHSIWHTVTLQAKLQKLCSDRNQDIKTILEGLR